MTTNFVIGLAVLVILVLAVAAIALITMVRGRKPAPPLDRPAASAPAAGEAPPPPEPEAPAEDAGAPLAVATRADLAGPADPLTTLKGLGPKAAAQLNALGITRYAQLAALDAAGVAALDARMGAFKGRIARDRWVEQAACLAAGDTAAFEATFGKLGGR